MRAVMIIVLMAVLILWMCICYPINGFAQYFRPWAPISLPFYPWCYMSPFPVYPGAFFGRPMFPVPVPSPILVEPRIRIANAPVTLTAPTFATTTPPLTAILNLIDPALLASNIAVLTNNFPTVFDLLVTTFQLPLL